MYVISLFGDKSIPLAGSPKVIDSSIATLTKKLSLCNRSKVIDDKDSGIKLNGASSIQNQLKIEGEKAEKTLRLNDG
jgi:hypothetical protein